MADILVILLVSKLCKSITVKLGFNTLIPPSLLLPEGPLVNPPKASCQMLSFATTFLLAVFESPIRVAFLAKSCITLLEM